MNIDDQDWGRLQDADVETSSILEAVSTIDGLRADLQGTPCKLSADMLILHERAMSVFARGQRGEVAALFDDAVDLEDRLTELIEGLDRARRVVSCVTELYPESLDHGDR